MFLSKLFKRTKNKVMVAIAGLTMVLGAGAALSVAAVSSNLIETNAASANIYFQDAAWWTTDMKTTYVYFWKSTDESVNNGWPGKAMTSPESISSSGNNIYSANYDTSLGYDRVIFSRTNESGVDAQTEDLTLSSENLFTVGGTAKWIGNGEKATGSWGTLGKSSYYLVGKGSFASSNWSTAGGIRLDMNAENPSDLGMLKHQYLTAGDAFTLSTGSVHKNFTNFGSGSLKWPAFTEGVKGNFQATVKESPSFEYNGTWSGTGSTSDPLPFYNTKFFIYVDNWSSDWYNDQVAVTNTSRNYVVKASKVSGETRCWVATINLGNFNKVCVCRSDGTTSGIWNYDSTGTNISSFYFGSGISYRPIYVNTSGYYDIYLTSGGEIYIRNSEDTSKGYLYFTLKSGVTTYSPTNYDAYIYAWDNNTDQNLICGDFPGLKYTSMYGHATTNLKFNSSGDLFEIPLSCLQGAGYFIISVYPVGSSTKTTQSNDLKMPDSLTSNCYINLAAAKDTKPATADGAAAKAAYKIANAIKGAPNQSVCNISSSDATTLCTLYDAASSNSKLTGATVTTWNSVKPTYSDSQNATMPNIRIQLGKIAGGGYVISLGHLSGPNNDQSPLTLTLWIVLGAGVLGLGAIGTAYFVSKKKKRHLA
ncbi:MAG: starch-binding protein [Bacilli bacterium]|nr:starch-binding protein [Bacilli bacterium]